ncbi:hypothetical protein HA402_002592 [Bradysia odoriphaga]|nr:hypothetical protein HA402_002592 [Bradysia odoriphaga]
MESAILSGSGSLEQLLTHIILKYFIQLYCVCVVSNTLDANHMIEINFNWIHEGEKYPQMIWLKYDAQESNQSNVDDLIRMSIDSGCQAFIASPNTVIDFLDAFENVRFTSKNRYHLVHVVALPTSTDKSAEYIQEILNHPSVQDIPNILIISPSVRKNETAGDFEGRFYDLITSTFVSRYNSQDRRLLDTFDTLNERFVDNANLFPEKFSDLEGRPVRLAMLSYNPNSLWEKVPAGFGNANLVGSDEEKNMITDGTETTMITSFCDVYNCTSTIFPADGVGDWGTIEDNYTGDGVLGAVVERRADIGVGAFYLWFEPPIDSTHQMVVKNIEWGITDGGDAWVYDLLDATEAILRHSNAKVQLGISISSDREKPEPVNLSLDHVSGAFAIFGIGCTCAVVAFIIESIYYRNRKPIDVSKYALIILRFIQGSVEGVTYPAMYGIWRFWAPPLERSRLATIALSGSYAGIVIGLPFSGYLAHLNWRAPFYFYGIVGMLWFTAFLWLVFEKPRKHPTIDGFELNYIEKALGKSVHQAMPSIPWRHIIRSAPFIAIVVANFCRSWNFYMLVLYQSAYLKQVFAFDIAEAGVVNALPHLLMTIITPFGGMMADYLRKSGAMTTTGVRKLFNCGGFGLACNIFRSSGLFEYSGESIDSSNDCCCVQWFCHLRLQRQLLGHRTPVRQYSHGHIEWHWNISCFNMSYCH